MGREVSYYVDSNDRMRFVIRNYTRAKTFSGFFPGIAGLMGIPLWCYYANRGQGICSFGTGGKDGAIMEFQPANKAYRLVSTHGFRTFIKLPGYDRDTFEKNCRDIFYEPFQDNQANLEFNIENLMAVRPYDLYLEEVNNTLGLSVSVKYFTIPEEPFAALARELTIRNNTGSAIELEVLDGMPVIIPYGMNDGYMKNMSRTMEAWYCIDNVENAAPYYRLKVNPDDSSEVIRIIEGNFYFGFIENQGQTEFVVPIIDPALIFGHVTDLTFPAEFYSGGLNPGCKQHFENRTPSAMGYAKLKLAAHTEKTIFSLLGKAESLESLNGLKNKCANAGFFKRKEEENRKLVCSLMDHSFVGSNLQDFDSYSRQNFLDNILRGGFPLTLREGDKTDVLYVYSRRHGDPERDYNSFRLEPAFFSQGNGAYRDINQNRRNDLWLNPDVGYLNIVYFMNLIQLDGYNPLVLKGVSYLFKDRADAKEVLQELTDDSSTDILLKFFDKPFVPHTLIKFLTENSIRIKLPFHEFLNSIILKSRKIEDVEHAEGFWTDHWAYNLDLLESYEGIFPEKMREVLWEKRLFSFYDNANYVVPRNERYVLYNNEPRQFGSVRKSDEKARFIAARGVENSKVRTGYGKGEIYRTTLFAKLLCICINKMASLDAHGTGIEMEAGKPNWDDAMNGLPSLFGSSVSETFELKRLVLLLKGWIKKFNLECEKAALPAELFKFFTDIYKELRVNLMQQDELSNFKYWDVSCEAKEKFRKKTLLGVAGKEEPVSVEAIEDFLRCCLIKLERGIENSFNKELGIYDTYFINQPVEYDVHPYLKVRKFRQIPLPPFLEGQVHAFRVQKNYSALKGLYDSVRSSGLYDARLGMYVANASLETAPMEIGRIKAFTPGWLENGSVFMHMEYKYLLELIKSGLYDEFFEDMKTALVPFIDPGTYGRSIFENSSFIASSANPDKAVHGSGFVARLSGTTAEFSHMLLLMAVGSNPFVVNDSGKLELRLNPTLPEWLFTTEERKTVFYSGGTEIELQLEPNTFSFNFLGGTLLVYHNNKRLNTYGNNSSAISKIVITGKKLQEHEINSEVIPAPYAENARKGLYRRIDVWLE